MAVMVADLELLHIPASLSGSLLKLKSLESFNSSTLERGVYGIQMATWRPLGVHVRRPWLLNCQVRRRLGAVRLSHSSKASVNPNLNTWCKNKGQGSSSVYERIAIYDQTP